MGARTTVAAASTNVSAVASATAIASATASASAAAIASAPATADATADAVAHAIAHAIAHANAADHFGQTQKQGKPMTEIELYIELQSYIADPYWPEREELINVQKSSGMNRARSTANRRKALEEHLKSVGMTLRQYEALEERASRPFYARDDGTIYIPRRQVTAMLVATCDTMRAAQRPCAPADVRSAVLLSEWVTNRNVSDAQTWERFAVVSSGTGAKLSNQRGLRRSLFIGAEPPDECTPTGPVEARGTVSVDDSMVEPKVLVKALEYAGRGIGIGASRKMGWGRFTVSAKGF